MPRLAGMEPSEQRAVTAAAKLFAQRGWSVTTRDIAKAGRLSPDTINYMHVTEERAGKTVELAAGKQALVAKVVEWAASQWNDKVGGDLIASVLRDPRERIASLFDRTRDAAAADPVPFVLVAHALFGLPDEDRAEGREKHPGRRLAEQHRASLEAVVGRLLTDAVRGKLLREQLASDIGALLYAVAPAVAAGRPSDVGSYRDAAVALVDARLADRGQ